MTQTATTGTDLAIETPAKVGLNAVCELSKKGQEGSTEFCHLRPEGSTAWVGFLESG